MSGARVDFGGPKVAATFYDDGVRFSCNRCSACCRGGPGYVFLTKTDLARLLQCLGLDFKAFFHDYCILADVGNGRALSLREVSATDGSNDCVFWGTDGCKVYEARPLQCSTYPFWQTIMESASTWRREAQNCPGIDTGEMRSKAYVEERLVDRRKAGAIVLSYGDDPESLDEDTLLGGSRLGPDAAHAVES